MSDYTPDPTTPVDISILNYPVRTCEARTLLNSNHKCNQAKAIAAFSSSVQNYAELMKRHGYSRIWTTKALVAFAQYVRTPDCIGIPFSDINDDSWWACMPYDSVADDYNLNDIIEALGILYDGNVLPTYELATSFNTGYSGGFGNSFSFACP